MKFLTAISADSRSAQAEHSQCGLYLETQSGWFPLAGVEGVSAPIAQTKDLIEAWPAIETTLQHIANSAPPQAVAIEKLQLAPPIEEPGKIICIGKNYANHAIEMGDQPPELPIVFSKFSSALIADGTDVVLPAISDQVDFEAELVVVIGKGGREISAQDALSHVFGYCCGNDISARDWQKGKPGGQWLLGKTFDTFAPLGPAIVTADEVGDPHQLDIQLRLNGKTMQSSNTNRFLFPIDFLIEHLSKFVELQAGDLIFTGTPEGVGAGRKPPLFLKPGDQLEVEISRLGVLKNGVVAG
jgi:2-keto-4-pentenoate hydratase/2-oxohepta-3-ene-1,7-dioic acid hydratase in catechol pathway